MNNTVNVKQYYSVKGPPKTLYLFVLVVVPTSTSTLHYQGRRTGAPGHGCGVVHALLRNRPVHETSFRTNFETVAKRCGAVSSVSIRRPPRCKVPNDPSHLSFLVHRVPVNDVSLHNSVKKDVLQYRPPAPPGVVRLPKGPGARLGCRRSR